jgi:hypothetical protein
MVNLLRTTTTSTFDSLIQGFVGERERPQDKTQFCFHEAYSTRKSHMHTLQQYKQKGRTLRRHLAAALGTDISLSQAYEALAAMEGAAGWNVLAARLAQAGSPSAPAPAAAPAATAVTPLPPVRALLRTVDGKAQAEFDASAWLAQASAADIAALKEEKPRMAPVGFELSYGGMNGLSDSVAAFAADSNEEVRRVYEYIRATTAAGQDCGGSDCYIDAHALQHWQATRAARQAPDAAGMKLVFDVRLGAPAHAALRAKICEQVRADAAHRHESADYRPTVQADIEEALACFNIVATGPDGAFADSVFEVMREALAAQGTPEASAAAPTVLYEKLSMLEVMMQDIVGDYEVPESVPEWQWVAQHAAFSHRDNGKEGGVWEFMVNVECARESDGMPVTLQPLFEQARRHQAVWVLFHQGT